MAIFQVHSHRLICNPSSNLSWARDPLLNFLAKCIIFKIPSSVSFGFRLFVLLLYLCLICYLLDSTLTLLYMCIALILCAFIVSIILASFKSIINQSRCSLEPKSFLRGLCPLKSLLRVSEHPPPEPHTCFSADVYS